METQTQGGNVQAAAEVGALQPGAHRIPAARGSDGAPLEPWAGTACPQPGSRLLAHRTVRKPLVLSPRKPPSGAPASFRLLLSHPVTAQPKADPNMAHVTITKQAPARHLDAQPLWMPPGATRPGTHKAVAHDAVEAFQRLQVLVGEVELDHPGVPEQRAQRGLRETAPAGTLGGEVRREVRVEGGREGMRREREEGDGQGLGSPACRSPAAAEG